MIRVMELIEFNKFVFLKLFFIKLYDNKNQPSKLINLLK